MITFSNAFLFSTINKNIALIIFGLIVIFLIFLFYFFKFKKNKNIKFPKFRIEEFSIKFVKFKREKSNPDADLAWKTIMIITTSVLMNTFDNNGNEKAVLKSIHSVFQNLKNNLINFKAPKSAEIILSLLNQELRPFLAKWNANINYYSVLNRPETIKYFFYKNKFKNDYELLVNKIENKKYLDRLGDVCGFKVIKDEHTDKSLDILKLSNHSYDID